MLVLHAQELFFLFSSPIISSNNKVHYNFLVPALTNATSAYCEYLLFRCFIVNLSKMLTFIRISYFLSRIHFKAACCNIRYSYTTNSSFCSSLSISRRLPTINRLIQEDLKVMLELNSYVPSLCLIALITLIEIISVLYFVISSLSLYSSNSPSTKPTSTSSKSPLR